MSEEALLRAELGASGSLLKSRRGGASRRRLGGQKIEAAQLRGPLWLSHEVIHHVNPRKILLCVPLARKESLLGIWAIPPKTPTTWLHLRI